MIKHKYEKQPTLYVPFELLTKEQKDHRNSRFLTDHQRHQIEKHLYYAKKIIHEDGTVTILNDKGEILSKSE